MGESHKWVPFSFSEKKKGWLYILRHFVTFWFPSTWMVVDVPWSHHSWAKPVLALVLEYTKVTGWKTHLCKWKWIRACSVSFIMNSRIRRTNKINQFIIYSSVVISVPFPSRILSPYYSISPSCSLSSSPSLSLLNFNGNYDFHKVNLFYYFYNLFSSWLIWLFKKLNNFIEI